MMTLDEYRAAYAWALDRIRAVADEVWDGLYDYDQAYAIAYQRGTTRRSLRVEYEYLANPGEVTWVSDGDDDAGGHWEPEGVARYKRFSLNACPDARERFYRWLLDAE